MTNLETYVYWIKERESIRLKKEQGLPKPWTDDPILQNYRFCNVEREKDTVSIWINANWILPNDNDQNMWFAMIVARLFNWPPTLYEIGYPKLINQSFKQWLEDIRFNLKGLRDDKGAKIFTGAYLVSTNGVKMDKIDYILDRVLTPIWEKGRGPRENESLESYWNYLLQFDGLGSFMAGQVIADLKYTSPLKDASDWWDWAPLGPGSIRGLNRFHGRPVDKTLKQDQGLLEICEAQKLIENELGWLLPAHNIQNTFCEYYKYCKIKYGEGRTRSRYQGVK